MALSTDLSPPQPLSEEHDVQHFSSGNYVLDEWLRHWARKAEGSTARTYVVVSGRQVVGYYALNAGSVLRREAPRKLRRNTPEPIPIILLGRLAVDQKWQGRGLGSGLLKDGLLRALQASDLIGVRALLVHAIDERALSFYKKYGLIEFPEGTKTLFLPIESLKDAVSTSSKKD